ncbi:MAG: cellulase family glycosylhydrolase [Saprospiraceae bacterium]|mgnify:FL=1
MQKFFGVIIFLVYVTICSAQYIQINQGKFLIGNTPFTPVILNYGVNIRYEGDGQWISRMMSYYTNPAKYNCSNKQDCLDDLITDLRLIRSKGFNVIRVFNFEFGNNSDNVKEKRSGTMDISYYYGPQKFHPFIAPFEDHFAILDQLIDAARKADIKIILLAGGKNVEKFPRSAEYARYLEALASRYKDEPSIIAYDLLNEPSYFAKGLSKKEIYMLVRQWCGAIRSHTKNQLITIGLGDSKTTFDWDPKMLDVDFYSYHLYPDNQGNATPYRNQLYYFSQISDKPWIIGETGFAASSYNTGKPTDGDLNAQKVYFSKTYQYCMDCGGLAYSWWQFHDVSWSPDYGLVDSMDQLKPFGEMISEVAAGQPHPEACIPDESYFQPIKGFTNFYSGKIIDEDGRPVAHALIVSSAVNGKSSFTFSKPDGTYNIYSKGTISVLKITASGYENRRRSAFFDNTTTRLKKSVVDEKTFYERVKSNNYAFCKHLAEQSRDRCIFECGNDDNCRKECRARFEKEIRLCNTENKK